jgi:probable F420-dependent oxidoreductase
MAPRGADTARVRVGALVQNFAGFPETRRSARACVDVALHAEKRGFDSVWLTDHLVLPEVRDARYPHNDSGDFPYRWDQDIHEPLVLMAAIAQATHRVEIGVAVLVIPYRNALLTAKMLATIDQIAQGRVILGAGVGWLRDEFVALQLPADVFEHRGSVTEDHLRTMRVAWTAPAAASYHGRWVSFDAVGTRPQPPRGGHLPVWVGGKGEQALRRAVRLGDGYLAIASDPTTLRQDVDRLHALAGAEDRDPAELTIALIDGIVVAESPLGPDRSPLHGSTEQIVEGLRAFADAGLSHLVAGVRTRGNPSFQGTVEALDAVAADVLPNL